MRSKSAAQTVFAIPELFFSVGDYCSRLSLTTVDSLSKSLTRNLPHIRTVVLSLLDHAILQDLAHAVSQTSQPGDAAVDPCAPQAHLKRLTLSSAFYGDIEPIFSSIVILLNHNISLTHLTIPFPEVKTGNPGLTAILNLKHLQSITAYSCLFSPVGVKAISLLLQACLPLPKLTTLHIDCQHYLVDTDASCWETIIMEATIARFSQTPTPGKIKSLHLPVWLEDNGNPVTLLLLESGLLDLESCSMFTFTFDDWEGVEHIVRNLLDHHCDTLEDFELVNCSHGSNVNQQAVLSRCNKLKRYYATAKSLDHFACFDIEDALNRDWACTELKELRLPLERNRYRSRLAAKSFYQQIGRLKKLKQLALDVNQSCSTRLWDHTWDLTLSRGWLGELAGLKNLRGLWLEAGFCMRMRKAEMKFFLEKWPLLCEINVVGEDASRVRAMAHWQWLIAKRPHLSFKARQLPIMKLGSAGHTVFTTPELSSTVFVALTPHDLTRCIRVCKEWSHQAEPVLWRHFCYGGLRHKRLSTETTLGLIRNLPHIRTVELTARDLTVLQELAHGATHTSQPGDPTIGPSATCTQLQRFMLESSETLDKHLLFDPYVVKDFPSVFSNIITILNHNLHLTHLSFPCPNVESNDPVLAAISNLKGLQYLCFNKSDGEKYPALSATSISLLLRACLPLPKLKELFVNCKIYWNTKVDGTEVPDLETILKEAAIARFSQTPTPGKIKALQLGDYLENSDRPLALDFLRSDLLDLESFTIPSFDDSSDIQELVHERCPNLKHLRRLYSDWCIDETRHVQAFIRGCSGLESFASENFSDHEYDPARHFYMSKGQISELVTLHCDTLEDFELTSCRQVASSDLQKVLSRCSRLKRFHVSGQYPETRDDRHPDGNAGFDVEDAMKGDWVCTELQELWITLGQNSPFCNASFYRQIGRLEKLEHLTLDANGRIYQDFDIEAVPDPDVHDLTEVMLKKMAGLTRLKSLRLGIELCRRMGDAEVEFLHKHWPLLREITIMGSKGLKLLTEKRWQSLLAERPDLRLIVLDDRQMVEEMHYLEKSNSFSKATSSATRKYS
ncbi:hypothetical protein EC968_005019 [Mortierella alpina]|nr:hypothetical protein EC968_005019 [Mortierella alpina]